MSNKITRAARERMARTGEPYTLARRMVIEEHAEYLKTIPVPGLRMDCVLPPETAEAAPPQMIADSAGDP